MARVDIKEAALPQDAEGREVEAEYIVESPVKYPYCNTELEVLKVVRLLRTRVNFTSTLPRRGRVLACPECQKIVSAELAGFA